MGMIYFYERSFFYELDFAVPRTKDIIAGTQGNELYVLYNDSATEFH